MFTLTVVDHVRLNSEHVARNYTVHATAADRLARTAFIVRLTVLVLIAAATITTVATLLIPTRPWEIAAASTAGLALFAFALYVASGIEAKVLAHRSAAHRLWLVTERYRTLVTEMDEGLVSGVALLERRDELITALHTIYESGFGVDQVAFERVRLAPFAANKAA